MAEIIKDNNGKAYIVTEIKNYGTNYDLSFRTYSLDNECGGFLTTYRLSGVSVKIANMFCAPESEVKNLLKTFGGKFISKKINNIVPSKFQYQTVKKKLI